MECIATHGVTTAAVGGAIAKLLSPDSGWITGQRIEASGGMFL